jgi:hypothetical protein
MEFLHVFICCPMECMQVVKSQSAPRQSEKTPSQRLLQVIGMRNTFDVFVLPSLNFFTSLLFLWDLQSICSLCLKDRTLEQILHSC